MRKLKKQTNVIRGGDGLPNNLTNEKLNKTSNIVSDEVLNKTSNIVADESLNKTSNIASNESLNETSNNNTSIASNEALNKISNNSTSKISNNNTSKKSSKKTQIVNTPYDDVFRTLLNDCRELILPVLNETFGEHYTGRERIVFYPNEHFLDQQDGTGEKRITDSSFSVISETNVEKKYLYECQSTADNSMLVRILEYATQVAIEQGELEGSKLTVEIPHCAVLFLRSTKNTPDVMEIEIKTPGGKVCFHVPVTKMKSYSLEQIFEKKLLFLIPFYIFTHESKFAKYDADKEQRMKLREEYIKILDYLNTLLENNETSVYVKRTIVELSNKVLESIAAKYANVKEEVKSVMGGKILDYEAKDILNRGKTEGKTEGIEGAVKLLQEVGLEDQEIIEKIMKQYELTLEEAKGYVFVPKVG